jgi:hypothetical protein
MTKPKYTPEERKRIMGENMLKNKAKATSNGYTQKSASRELAIAEGKKTYTGNTSCKNCGSFEKYVSSYNCVSCAVKTGLEKLNNEELMKPYRTKEKQNNKTYRYRSKKLNFTLLHSLSLVSTFIVRNFKKLILSFIVNFSYDCEKNIAEAELYKIKEYPTIILVKNNKKYIYDANLSESTLDIFINTVTNK